VALAEVCAVVLFVLNDCQMIYTAGVCWLYSDIGMLNVLGSTHWKWLLAGRWLRGYGSGSWLMNEWRRLSSSCRCGLPQFIKSHLKADCMQLQYS